MNFNYNATNEGKYIDKELILIEAMSKLMSTFLNSYIPRESGKSLKTIFFFIVIIYLAHKTQQQNDKNPFPTVIFKTVVK